MASANFNIQPNDGWVAVTSGPVSFVKIKQYPKNHPIYVTSGSSAPNSSVRGFRVECDNFYVNVTTSEVFYVRTEKFKPDIDLRVDVFTLPVG